VFELWISRNKEKDQTKADADKNSDEDKTNTQVTAGKNGNILLLQFTNYKPVVTFVDLFVTMTVNSVCLYLFVLFSVKWIIIMMVKIVIIINDEQTLECGRT